MQPVPAKHSIEEISGWGDEIYENQIRHSVEAAHVGKVVAIDVDTGVYEMAENELLASRLLRQRVPDAQIWLRRIGHCSLYRIGRQIDLAARRAAY